MHLALFDPEDKELLKAEIMRSYSDFNELAKGICSFSGTFKSESLVYARQVLPDVKVIEKDSISGFTTFLSDFLLKEEEELGDNISIHIFSVYENSKSAGARRAEIIRDNLREFLKQKRRSIFKKADFKNSAFQESSALLQLLMVSPEKAYFSYCPPYFSFNYRGLISHVANGRGEFFPDKLAPSRAFLKLISALERLGEDIKNGESVTDLGASPGGWSYVALNKGAKVTAVDRAELDSHLINRPNLKFVKANAFNFEPESTVDWLICDVIAFPEKTLELLRNWSERKLMKKFVVTFKFKGKADLDLIFQLKKHLAATCSIWVLTRLEFNKNEITAMGVLNS